MKKRETFFPVLTLILATAATAPGSIAAEAVPEVPGVVHHEAYEQPVWVSQSALDADPSLLSAVLPPGTVELIAGGAKTGECIEMTVRDEPIVSGAGAASLSDDVRRAEKILLVTIAGSETGLFQGRPGSLLRVAVVETFFGGHRGGEELVFVPIGDVRVAGRRLCGTDPRYPTVPAVGQEVFLVVPRHWFNAGDILFVGGSRGFLPIVDGEVRGLIPREEVSERPLGKDGFVRWIHDLRAGRNGS